jgi:hypothetical protein
MSRTRALVASLIALFIAAPAQAAEPRWVSTGPTAAPHFGATSAVLADGSVLLIGGGDGVGEARAVERFDPATDRWSTVTPLTASRAKAGAVTLRDGRVLVAGGAPFGLAPLASAELYSPLSGAWTAAASMHAARSGVALVLLDDGRALAVSDTAKGEIYDPGTREWTETAAAGTVRRAAAVTKLADGRVLVAGGEVPGTGSAVVHASAEIYDPVADTWTPAAPMRTKRTDAPAALLPDGRVVVAGGFGESSSEATFEIYDPAADTWAPPAALNRSRRTGARMTRLSDGRLVLTGGFTGGLLGREQSVAELFDPGAGTWTETPPAAYGRSQHVAAALGDGSLLVVGSMIPHLQSERLVFTPPTPTHTPTPTPNPEPPPAPARLSVQRAAVRAATASTVVRCNGAPMSVCTALLELKSGKPARQVAFQIVMLRGGEGKTYTLTLPAKQQRGLKRAKLKATFVATSGNLLLARHAVTFKQRPAKRRGR